MDKIHAGVEAVQSQIAHLGAADEPRSVYTIAPSWVSTRFDGVVLRRIKKLPGRP